MLVLIIHAIIKPEVIILIGINLINIGSINILLVKSIIHLIALPAKIDIDPRSIVGVIILMVSLILVNELDRLGLHKTTKLNRAE
jgi:hypothetical protein